MIANQLDKYVTATSRINKRFVLTTFMKLKQELL